MNKAFSGLAAVALALPLAAGATTSQATPTPGASHARIARPHNDLLSAQRALSAAKLFLAKAPNDSAGHRSKAQQALETALAQVNAEVKEQGLP